MERVKTCGKSTRQIAVMQYAGKPCQSKAQISQCLSAARTMLTGGAIEAISDNSPR